MTICKDAGTAPLWCDGGANASADHSTRNDISWDEVAVNRTIENGNEFANFDINSKDHRKNIETAWDRMRCQDTLPHSGEHGGFYVLTKYGDVTSAARNAKDFSSAE